MDWDQNEELVEQILRTGMYAKLYDEETTYGYLTYLTYRVEETLFTWKKESDEVGPKPVHIAFLFPSEQRVLHPVG